jgi:hypothetical protein
MMKMNFYRLATEEDFSKRFSIQLDYLIINLPEEVEKMIEEDGEFLKAAAKMRQITGKSIQECKTYCAKYRTFVKAKIDFYEGKPVYTEY